MANTSIQTIDNTFSLNIEQIKSLAFIEPQDALATIVKLENSGTKELSMDALHELYLVKAHTYLQLNAYEEATRCINTCLEHALLNKQDLLQLRALNYRSQIEIRQANFDQVIRTSNEAILLAKDLYDFEEQAMAHNSMGIAYGSLYAYEESLEALLAGLALKEHLDEVILYRLNNNASNVYYFLGHYEHALTTLKAATNYVDIQDNPRTRILSNANFGKIHAKLGNIKQAEDYLCKAKEIVESTPTHSDLLVHVYADLADFYIQQERYDEGVNILGNALNLEPTDQNESQKISLNIDLAKCYIGQKSHHQAISVLGAALQLKTEATPKSKHLEIHKTFSEAFEKLHNYQKSLEHYKYFHDLKDEIHDERSQARMQGMMIKHNTERLQDEHDRLANEKELAKLRLLKLEKDNQKLVEENTRDGLTGAYNRRYLNEKLEEVFKHAKQNHSPLSVVMSDIDFFKQVNDTFSHAIGDEVLKAIARIFMDNTREQDTVARYGGEEFVVIFDRSHKGTAVTIAEKLRVLVEQYPWKEIHPELSITISMGIASGFEFDDYEAMLNNADLHMYSAKRSGKNQVHYS